jgi:hypothetical protein
MDALHLGDALRQAFRLGEARDPVGRSKAIDMYRAVVSEYPSAYDAWFNLGVVQSRNGQWRAAVQSLGKAQESPEFRLLAAFGRLKLVVDNGGQVSDADLPEEFRGDKRGVLGVHGPCHNAANELRNMGYPCTVEGKGKSCSIVSVAGATKYTITLGDLNGLLLRNVFREERGKNVNLGDIEHLSQTDLLFGKLEVGRLPLIQTPIPGALDAATYSKLRSAASRSRGPHGWTREGSSFDEVAALKKTDAARHGIEFIQVLSVEDIARRNCQPGVVFLCVLDGEPHAVAVLREVRDEHTATIRRSVGACILRAEFFSMPEYPIVHIGLGIPVEYLGETQVRLAIVDNLVDFMEANFQDWVNAVEAKGYTAMHVYGPEFSHIATGRKALEAEIVASLVGALDRANAACEKIAETALDFKKAGTRFYEQHPDPFIWSAK